MYLWRLLRPVHSAWLVAIFCFGIVVGVIAVPYIDAEIFGGGVWLVVGGILAAIGLWRRTTYALVFMIVAGGVIGLWRGTMSSDALAPYAAMQGKYVTATGVVSDDADTDAAGHMVLRLQVTTVDDNSQDGSIWVSVISTHEIQRGDIVTVGGVMSEGFGSFAASMYRAQLQGIRRPVPGDVAVRVRDWFAEAVRRSIAEPEASLGIGFLVGQRRSLPEDLDAALRTAGLMHIVVASGYNLTILVRLTRRLFERISKYLTVFAGAMLVVGFVAVTGMSPSMSRAGLVTGLCLLAWYYGRTFHPVVLLLVAAAVTLIVQPAYGWGDLGWQLSFAAFTGVMIVAPLANRYFFGTAAPGFLRQIVGETIAAQIVTFPIIMVAFGQFSMIATIANSVIVPFVPLAMLCTFAAGVGALAFPMFAQLWGVPASIVLQYMTNMTRYFADIPWAQASIALPWQAAAIYYVALLVACVYMGWRTQYSLRDVSVIE